MTQKYTEVIFDVETQKFFDEIDSNDAGDLGISIVSAYTRDLDENLNETGGKMQSFWENEIKELWPIFQQADRIIGFNSIGFDVPSLVPYTNFPIKKLPHFDIMYKLKEVLGHRISLDAVAKQTLGNQKTDHGSKAVEYWRKGDKQSLAKLKKYCEADVILTRDIYDYALKNNKLLFKDKWNTQREVQLDFSYPKKDSSNRQIGLF